MSEKTGAKSGEPAAPDAEASSGPAGLREHCESCTAFAGYRRLASGSPLDVALALRVALDEGESATIIVVDDETSRTLELDLRGSVEEIRSRAEAEEAKRAEAESAGETGPKADADPEAEGSAEGGRRKRGRPKLGVIGREITLLPRHWAWLGEQPGSASVTLRKLVERARRQGLEADRRRHARDAAYRFMSTLAGDLPGFEEASRALFAGEVEQLGREIEEWPEDVRDHTRALVEKAFSKRSARG